MSLASILITRSLLATIVTAVPQSQRVNLHDHLIVSDDDAQSDHAEVVQIGFRGGATVMRREDGSKLMRPFPTSPESESMIQTNSTATQKGILQCGWTVFAPDDPCPVECPLLAEMPWDPCHFQCVTADKCGQLDPKATVADHDQKRCRRCIVAGCDICDLGGEDKCHQCSLGFYLDNHGTCFSGGEYLWHILKIVVALIAVVLGLWTIELFCRRPTNEEGLSHGIRFRKRTRCHMPHDTPHRLGVIDEEDSEGVIYPLSTNLIVTPVGGVGTSLHFSFQAYLIFWSLGLAASYAYWAMQNNYDMLRIGTLPAQTPQQFCSVLQWGAKQQDVMMEDTFLFCLWAWAFQIMTSLGFAFYQQFRFRKMDDLTTMKDFACFVRGLPKKKGTEDVESGFKDFLEKETGQKVVGVSVAWDVSSPKVFERVNEALEHEASEQEKAHTLLKNGGNPVVEQDDVAQPLGFLSRVSRNVDKLFGFGVQVGAGERSGVDVDRVRELLEEMTTSDVAFAVFETEEARDAAVDLAKSRHGLTYDEKNVVRLETKACEPGTVRWDGISYGSRTRTRNKNMVYGAGLIILALAAWCIAFYMPYAYFVTSFTYANGNEPSFFANMAFTMLVVAGNQIMYFMCDFVTVNAGFAFEDERELWYNVYYLLACIANVALDMVITGVLGYEEMVGIGIHTADGKLLESLTSFQAIIESYPMQKTLGNMLFAYCFTGTFLLPFLLEPIGTIFLPEMVYKRLLRSHPECRNREAELSMQFFTSMDLGRYSDLLLNMCLSVMILFLPGGYVLPMFLSMGLSHVYIYVYDHWRVLRAVPDFCFSRNVVDQFGTDWMALPAALTLGCAVFKGYHIYWPDLHGWRLLCVMLWAFGFSLVFHLFLLRRIYKMKLTHERSAMTYAECAKHEPKTWFSANPIHCLRSKYIWGYMQPQVFFMPGKAHLQRANPKIGTYFENKEAQKPDTVSEEGKEDDVPKTATGKYSKTRAGKKDASGSASTMNIKSSEEEKAVKAVEQEVKVEEEKEVEKEEEKEEREAEEVVAP
mmetsp:Transcript_1945/g.3426  ORF Transcript_1945/g.3426 Transcript_1945/m.3426 type:complete len:1037 (+) Transcript_1945:76-3186(+)